MSQKYKIEYGLKSDPIDAKPAKRYWLTKSKEEMIAFFENHPKLKLVRIIERVM